MKTLKFADSSIALNERAPEFLSWLTPGAIIRLPEDKPVTFPPGTAAWYLPAAGDVFVCATDVIKVHTPDDLPTSIHEILDGEEIEEFKQEEVFTILGMLQHEASHSAWSRWMETSHDYLTSLPPKVWIVMLLLEELRIEFHATEIIDKEATIYGKTLLRHCFRYVLGTADLTRESYSERDVLKIWLLVAGRHIAGVCHQSEVEEVDNIARATLGDFVIEQLTGLVEEAINLRMYDIEKDTKEYVRIAKRILDLVGDAVVDVPPCAETSPGAGVGGNSPDEGDGSETGDVGDGDGEGEDLSSVIEVAIADMIGKLAGKDVGPDTVFMTGTGVTDTISKDSRITRKSSWKVKPPSENQQKQAIQVARVLEKLNVPQIQRVVRKSQLPPGRLDMRQAMQREVDHAQERRSTATPWKQTRKVREDAKPTTVAILTDVSGSMQWAEESIAALSYIVARAGRRVHARTTSLTFGDIVECSIGVNDTPKELKIRSARDGRELFYEALVEADQRLQLKADVDALRIIVVVSDGILVEKDQASKSRKLLAELLESGARVIWLGAMDSWMGKLAAIWSDRFVLSYGHPSADEMVELVIDACRTGLH